MAGLTPDQLDLFEEFTPKPRQTAQQTPEQARNLAVLGFKRICELEGAGRPADEDVLAEMERRSRTEPRTFGSTSKADPELIEALYSGEVHSIKPIPKRIADETHDERMRRHFRQAANMQMFMADEGTWPPSRSGPTTEC
jgi:hypothetical protein